jgi:hypothetical protein
MQHTTATFYPSGDTYVYKNKRDETKLSRAESWGSGDKEWLRIFKEGNTGQPVRMAFLKFDVSLPTELQALESKGYQVTVTSASLQVHVKNLTVSEAKLWAVNDTSWDANTLSYGNMPNRSDSAIASLPTGEEFSVDSAATFQLSTIPSLGGSVAFAITTSMTSNCCRIGFYSSDTDYPPKLQLSFNVTRSSRSSSLSSLEHVHEIGRTQAGVRRSSRSSSLSSLKHVDEIGGTESGVRSQRPAARKNTVRLSVAAEIDSVGAVSQQMSNSPR